MKQSLIRHVFCLCLFSASILLVGCYEEILLNRGENGSDPRETPGESDKTPDIVVRASDPDNFGDTQWIEKQPDIDTAIEDRIDTARKDTERYDTNIETTESPDTFFVERDTVSDSGQNRDTATLDGSDSDPQTDHVEPASSDSSDSDMTHVSCDAPPFNPINGFLGDMTDLVIHESVAYAALGDAGLALMEVSSEKARMLGRITTEGRAIALAVSGGYAYVLNEKSGVSVVDVSDPGYPESVAKTKALDGGLALLVNNNMLFVLGDAGVYIFDISSPLSVVETAIIPITEGTAIQIDGSQLFISDELGDIYRVNISEPYHPAIERVVTVGDVVRNMVVENEYLFAVSSDRLFVVKEISESLSLTKTLDIKATAWELVMGEGRLYISTTAGTSRYAHNWMIVKTIDIFNPEVPWIENSVIVGSRGTSVNGLLGTNNGMYVYTEKEIRSVSFENSMATIAGRLKLNDEHMRCTPVDMRDDQLFRFCNATLGAGDIEKLQLESGDLKQVGKHSLPTVIDMVISDDRRWGFVLSENTPGPMLDQTEHILNVVDWSDDQNPDVAAVVPLGARSEKLDVTATLCAVVRDDLDDPLWLIDISEPDAPMVAASDFVKDSVEIKSLKIVDDLLYLSTYSPNQNNAYVTLFDVSNPKSPILIEETDVDRYFYQMIVHEDVMFGLANEGLWVFDTTEPLRQGAALAFSGGRFMGVDGDRLYIQNGIVIDISEPRNPMRIEDAQMGWPEHIYQMVIAPGRSVVSYYDSTNSQHMVVFDLVDDNQTEIVADRITWDSVADIEVSNKTAYLLYSSHLDVLDVSDPIQPKNMYSMPFDFSATMMGQHHGVICVGTESNELRMIDVENPTSPSSHGVAVLPSNAIDIAVDDAHAYITCNDPESDEESLLVIVNIADIDAPYIQSQIRSPIREPKTVLNNTVVHLRSVSNGWCYYDVADANDPRELQCRSDRVYRMFQMNDYLYVETHTGEIYDVSEATMPKLVDTYSTGWGPGGPGPLLGSGNILFSCDFPIEVQDVSKSTPPVFIGYLPTDIPHWTATVSDDAAYFWDSSELYILDMKEMTEENLDVYSEWRFDTTACELALADNGLIGAAANEIVNIDISEPSRLTVQGRLKLHGDHLQVSNSLAFISQDGELHILELGGSTPKKIGTVKAGTSTDKLRYLGQKEDAVFVGSVEEGILTYDIRDPTAPQMIGHYVGYTSGTAHVQEDRMYTVSKRFAVLNISDETNIKAKSVQDLPGDYRIMAVENDVMLLGNNSVEGSNLMIFDISDKDAPVLMGQMDGGFDAVVIQDNMAYAISDGKELMVIDMVLPEQPILLTTIPLKSDSTDLAIDNRGYLYVADCQGPVQVWDTHSFVCEK